MRNWKALLGIHFTSLLIINRICHVTKCGTSMLLYIPVEEIDALVTIAVQTSLT